MSTAEIPKLSSLDRRRLLDRIMEDEDEDASLEAIRQTADENFHVLDGMEAEALVKGESFMTEATTSASDSHNTNPRRQPWPISLHMFRMVTAVMVWLLTLKFSDNNPIVVFLGVLLAAIWIYRLVFDNRWLAAAFALATTTHVCSILALLFSGVLHGTHIDATALAVAICGMASLSLCFGVPLSIIAWGSNGCERLWSIFAIVLNVVVFPVYSVLLMVLILATEPLGS
jgi:hypothetical protein